MEEDTAVAMEGGIAVAVAVAVKGEEEVVVTGPEASQKACTHVHPVVRHACTDLWSFYMTTSDMCDSVSLQISAACNRHM